VNEINGWEPPAPGLELSRVGGLCLRLQRRRIADRTECLCVNHSGDCSAHWPKAGGLPPLIRSRLEKAELVRPTLRCCCLIENSCPPMMTSGIGHGTAVTLARAGRMVFAT
jgi:hypothetical protein